MQMLNWRKTPVFLSSCLLAAAIAAPAQQFRVLHSFDGLDGSGTVAALVQGIDGNFYGTASSGGAYGSGTVFKITASGTLATLYNFCPGRYPCPDGAIPNAPLVQGGDANFYGTTFEGGEANNVGTVLKVTPKGVLATLYSFYSQSGCTDGQEPRAGLIQATDGNFYGTTSYAQGTAIKIKPAGALITLYTFPNDAHPSTLLQANDGNFYGTTVEAGSANYGTVFKMTPSGALTTLYSFCSQSNCADGANPEAGLVQATDGNLYGTTALWGANGMGGTIFEVTPSGSLMTLYNFCSQTACADGQSPYAQLVQDTNGGFYGTTTYGRTAEGCVGGRCGTVFGLSVGLGPFVRAVPAFGKMGRSIIILGTKLTGATSVDFNGTATTFAVESATYIKTTVPVGATTGPVQVVTPNGTLTSNVNFQVLP